MPTRYDIEQLSGRIAEYFHPRRIILFGSYARGDAQPGADVDLLIEKEGVADQGKAAIDLALALRAPFPVDYVVRTPEYIRTHLEWRDPFLHDALREGLVLYAT